MIIRASALGEIMAPAKSRGAVRRRKTFIKKALKRSCLASATYRLSKYTEKGTR